MVIKANTGSPLRTQIQDFDIKNIRADNFDTYALRVFQYQYQENVMYRQFVDALHVSPHEVKSIAHIPFLPVSFFKTHHVVCGNGESNAVVFESSTTTGLVPSRHYVTVPTIYEQSLSQGFEKFYGAAADYAILALLPSYLERGNSSLVYMVKYLIDQGGHPASGFYLEEYENLSQVLAGLEALGQRTLLIGVTFALLDFADVYPMRLKNTIVMETGGMKGRREELTREEVHNILKHRWGLEEIHSEYGMTELLSQAYSAGQGIFECTDTMRVLVRDVNDPMDLKTEGVGALNIIDLANINSCSFIATDDIGRIATDRRFEVLGRLDNSALRGCNLMVV